MKIWKSFLCVTCVLVRLRLVAVFTRSKNQSFKIVFGYAGSWTFGYYVHTADTIWRHTAPQNEVYVCTHGLSTTSCCYNYDNFYKSPLFFISCISAESYTRWWLHSIWPSKRSHHTLSTVNNAFAANRHSFEIANFIIKAQTISMTSIFKYGSEINL
jgi:hypothetical protein